VWICDIRVRQSVTYKHACAAACAVRHAMHTRSLAPRLRLCRHVSQPRCIDDAVRGLVRRVEAKDPSMGGHARRLAEYAAVIGQQLGMSDDNLHALRVGALLHDVGKIGVDENIIRKAGPLTDDEYRVMQQHTLIGERLVQPLHCASSVMAAVRHHHERWDGRGYPDRLAGDSIPLHARIIAVVDAFDAMTTQRSYNTPLTFASAAGMLSAGAGTIWDPDSVTIFLCWLRTMYTGTAAGQAELAEQAVDA